MVRKRDRQTDRQTDRRDLDRKVVVDVEDGVAVDMVVSTRVKDSKTEAVRSLL